MQLNDDRNIFAHLSSTRSHTYRCTIAVANYISLRFIEGHSPKENIYTSDFIMRCFKQCLENQTYEHDGTILRLGVWLRRLTNQKHVVQDARKPSKHVGCAYTVTQQMLCACA